MSLNPLLLHTSNGIPVDFMMIVDILFLIYSPPTLYTRYINEFK